MRTNWAMRTILLVIINLDILSAQPDTLWTKTYGGTNGDIARCVQVTNDGGYVLTGSTASYGAGDMDVYIIKTDSLGDTLWTRVYGGSFSDKSYWVECTVDSGYIIAGYHILDVGGNIDVWLIKLDAFGDTLWTRTYGGSGTDGAYSVSQIVTNEYMVIGGTSSYGAGMNDIWLLKVDSLGDTIWTRTYGGPQHDGGVAVFPTTDQGFMILGGTSSYGAGQSDAWLIKTDSLGNAQWTKTYGGTNYDFVYEMVETQDHGYFITGMTQSFGSGNSDAWFIRTDSLGDTLWTKTYGDTGYEYAVSGVQTADGGYIACGYKMTNWIYDLWIIKLDSLGDQMWTKLLGHGEHDHGQSIRQTADLGYICAGYYYISGGSDIWLIRLESESGIADDFAGCPVEKHDYISVVPNPFRHHTKIIWQSTRLEFMPVRVKIYNSAGRLVREFNYPAINGSRTKSIIWNGEDEQGRLVRPGVYFCRLESHDDNIFVSQKLILVK